MYRISFTEQQNWLITNEPQKSMYNIQKGN